MVRLAKHPVDGKEIIIFEETPHFYIWIYRENLDRLAEDLFHPVQKDPEHPARGKTLRQLIAEDSEDRMGWGRYVRELKELRVL